MMNRMQNQVSDHKWAFFTAIVVIAVGVTVGMLNDALNILGPGFIPAFSGAIAYCMVRVAFHYHKKQLAV